MNKGVEALKEYQAKVARGEIERPKQRNPIERSQDEPKSKAKAIEAKCYDCIYDPLAGGNWRTQVKNCECVDCPLWKVRPGA